MDSKELKPCPTCHGTGEVSMGWPPEDVDPCPDCQGTGLLNCSHDWLLSAASAGRVCAICGVREEPPCTP